MYIQLIARISCSGKNRSAQAKLQSWTDGTDYGSRTVPALKAVKLRDSSLICYGWCRGSETRCI